jgi:hypothetical protein
MMYEGHAVARRTLKVLWMAAAWLMLLVSGSASVSVNAAEEDIAGAQPLRYRRTFVPANRIGDWPRDSGVRYRPMPKEDFERLVSQLKTTTLETPSGAVRVVSAHYSAALNDDVLRGRAVLEIVRAEPENLPIKGSADLGSLLRLDPCSLAVHSARWAGESESDAAFGLDATGCAAVLVPRCGTLEIEWSLRGTRSSDRGLVFDFALPKVIRSSLQLDLPDGKLASATQGAFVARPDQPGSAGAWQLELGGNHQFTLNIIDADSANGSQRLALVRQTTTYSFSPRGLELTVQLTIDAGKEPLRQLELSVDPRLQLLAIRQGESRVGWSVAADDSATDDSAAGEPTTESRRKRILLELPQPLTGTGNILRLAATAPMVLHESWRLPDVRAMGMFWQEGRATLLFPKPLVMEKLSTADCRQTSTGPLPPPFEGETLGLQYFVPEATIDVVVAHASQRLSVSSAAIIELAEDAIHARETTQLRLSDGQLFALVGEVAHEWAIDSVESFPSGRIKDWSLDSPGSGKRRLEIQLEQALSAAAPLRLVISGHRLNPSLADPVTLTKLRFVEWNQSIVSSRAISLRSPDNYHLKLRGEESLDRLNPKQLPAEVESLLAEPVSGLTFFANAKAAGLEIALERHAPQYTATIEVEAVASAGPFWETYSILCRPQSSRVERVVVQFSHPRQDAPRWSLASDGESGVVARRLVDEPAEKEDIATGETWELVLKRPRSTPFEIRATRAVEMGRNPQAISLASLPEASSQQGELSIRFSPGVTVEILNHSLKPLSIDSHESPRGQRSSVLRSAYRYVPGHDGLAVAPPAIALVRQASSDTIPGAVAWRATLQSRYDPAGNAWHVATWLLENLDRSSVRLSLPADAEDVAMWIDDKRLSPRLEDSSCDVILPAAHAFPTLVATFRTPAPKLQFLTRIAPPLPAIDVPVLADQWIVWLPPGYQLSDAAITASVGPQGFNAWRRLFGPLASSASGGDALALGDWTSWLHAAGRPVSVAEPLRQIVEQLGQELPAGATRAARNNWGRLLQQLQRQLESSQRTILVDWRALAEAGVSPRSSVNDQGSSSPWQRGLERLQQAELVLLDDDPAVLLTTMAAAATYRTELAPLSSVSLGRVRTGSLHDALQRAVRQRGSSHFHLASQWAAEPALPWAARQSPPLDPADVHGWSAYSLELAATSSAYVVRQSAISVLGWGLFLAIVVLGWRSQGRPVLLIALTGLAMAAALILPETIAPLGTCAVLALLFCLAMHAIRPRRLPDRSTTSAQAFVISDNMPTTAASLSLLLAVSALCNGGRAQETASSPVHKVFIPTDDKDAFTGEHYWVPEALYTRLQRSAAESVRAPRGWLLEKAEYRAEGSWDVAQQRVSIPEIKCDLDLQVFEPDCRVVLPLKSGAPMPSDETRLLVDGRQHSAVWSPAGDSLSFDVAEAGHYRVQIALRPTTSVDQGVSSIDLGIPPVATSWLELRLPRTAPSVEVASARGSAEVLDDGQRMIVHLGNAPRLWLRWRDGANGRSLQPAFEAEQLVWMHIQPGSVTADVTWKVRVLEGAVRTLRVALDPRWQLQPGDDAHPPVTQVRGGAGAPQLLQFDLPQPVTDLTTIKATLRLAGASGVGTYRIPYLEPLDVRSARQWLALSIDGSLEYRETGAETLTSLSGAEFVAQWAGEAMRAGEAMPQRAYRLNSSLPQWSVAARPAAVHKMADSLLALSIASERAEMRFEATIESSGPNFQHRIAAPKDLAIASIAIIEDEVDRLAHWSRDEDGTLTLFLNELAGGPQHITIVGLLPLPRRGPWKLPVVRVDDAEFRSAQVRIYRQPLQLVTLRGRSGLVEQPEQQRALENQDPEQDSRFAGMGRILSLLKAEEPAYAATLQFSPNQPKFTGTQTTTLRRDANQWQAEVDCQIEVTSGIVDLLRFDIPDHWQGPFQVTPAASTLLTDAGSDGKRQLIVRPFAPVTGQYRLKLSGPVAAPSGPPLAAPAIALDGAQRLTQTLLLPTQLELQPVTWKTRGLVRVDAEATTDGDASLKGMEAFRVVDSSYSAELMPAVRTASEPEVYLADISLSFGSAGDVQGVASFDLDPGGSDRCLLHLPAACRVLQVSVNGVPASLSRKSDRAWQIGLGSDQLPQRIEVVFASQADFPSLDARRWRLIAPQLDGLQVQRWLWTIYDAGRRQIADTAVQHHTSALQQELERMRSMAALLDLAPALIPNELGDDFEAWYAPWARRLAASLAAVRQELPRTRDADLVRSVENEIRGIEEQQLEIARQLGMPESLLGSGDPVAAEQSRQIWQWTSPLYPASVRLTSSETSPELQIEPTSTLAAPASSRALWMLAVALITALAIALLRSRWWEVAVAWRHAAGVALGIAWWLLFSPALVGWLIVLASLLAAWRGRRRPRRETGSSVVRLGASSHG